MHRRGRTRTSKTQVLYCNKHGFTDWVLNGIKQKKWKCLKCGIEYTTLYRYKKKLQAIIYKGGKCELCGYHKYISALDFHHSDPSLKVFELGGTGIQKSWDKLKPELDKCQLLCRNCHFEVHEEMEKNKLNDDKQTFTNSNRKEINKINSKILGKNISL